eukprot:GAHX01004073.1.p2 GENE.GAHX01004073.1~~GAHX01004073.1.p2  ORF type:complete len:61 (-),score=0.50 GAHX01004073.1:192-374(-)
MAHSFKSNLVKDTRSRNIMSTLKLYKMYVYLVRLVNTICSDNQTKFVKWRIRPPILCLNL